MQNSRELTLEEQLVSLLDYIQEMESKVIVTGDYRDISCSNFHIIHAIGNGEPETVTEVARKRNITVGTVNVAMNALEKKGYIVRIRSEEDRRCVLVSLTRKGHAAYEHHMEFHRKMIEFVISDLDHQDKKVLEKLWNRLMHYHNLTCI